MKTYSLSGEIKTHFRGRLHAIFVLCIPIYFQAIYEKINSDTEWITFCIILFGSVLLYTVSSIYHCFQWNQQQEYILRIMDISNIFICGSCYYTGFYLLMIKTNSTTTTTNDIVGIAFDQRRDASSTYIIWLNLLCTLIIIIMMLRKDHINNYELTNKEQMIQWIHGLTGIPIMYICSQTDVATHDIVYSFYIIGVSWTIGGIMYGYKWPNPHKDYVTAHDMFHYLTGVGDY
jgi:channel protein (hemolysin III family)